MIRCDSGLHFYDAEQHRAGCPYCGVDLEIGATEPVRREAHGSPTPPPNSEPPTQPKRRPPAPEPSPASSPPVQEVGSTVRVVRNKQGEELDFDPVVGWLVCVEGPDRGRDYRIRSQKNWIGRSPQMQIQIQGDATIHGQKHAFVSFNPRYATFTFGCGDGTSLVYLNDEEIHQPTRLTAYDIIELGKTRLMFVPLCGENFDWGTEDET